MKTNKTISLLGLLGLIAYAGLTAPGQETIKYPSFDWAGRPQLTSDQQKLLHLFSKLADTPSDSAKRQPLKEEVERLVAKLGSSALRMARPGELIVSRLGPSRQASIYNPTDENIAFTVAVKGDEEWIGSRKGSIGRQTYLPAKGTLSVTNLYWTTPRMTHRK